MNCQDFESVVPDLASRQVVSSEEAERAQAHAAVCTACAALLAEQQNLTLSLKALASQTGQEQAPERVEAALRLKFKSQSALAGRQTSEPRPAVLSRLAWGIAAVVVVGVGIVIAARFRRTPSTPPVLKSPSQAQLNPSAVTTKPRPEQAPAQSTRLSQPRPTRAAPANVGLLSHAGSTRRLVAHRPARRAPAASENANREVVTAFYPLPYGSGLSLDDGWELVRVRMPVAALSAIGVPLVDEASATQFVKADVVLGGDGMARAIRFVQ
ncbi:MAG TPA: hypothetical protein VG204_01220 [Terriglobia bacterium]|nr:hypothetical protein [Terriglobia bacterium]